MASLAQPKKPAGGAYGQFMNEKRAEFQKELPGQKASEVAKLGGERWKKLGESEKAVYQKRYEAAKAKYDEDLKAFEEAGGVKERVKRKGKDQDGKAPKKQKDPNRPKKPAGGAYGIYLNENREAIKKSLPKDHKITDVSKKAGEQWKALSEAAKKPYQQKYEKKSQEYKAAMEEYKKTHGKDEAEEDGDDEEAEEEEGKKPYQQKYEKKSEEYKAAMEEYKKTHGKDVAEDDDEDEEEQDEEPAMKKARLAGC